MRNRYFSPEALPYSTQLPSPSSTRLKLAGSIGKLPPSSSPLADSERRVGAYTYNTKDEVGAGYSSKVYRGKNTKEGSECAIKVIDLRRYNESSLKLL